MKKHITTKRALLASVLAVALCFAMLIGTTFAWFTDTASSKNNKIQSGTLLIDLLEKDGNGDYQSIKANQNAVFDNDLWEPGYTEVENIQVKNLGTLALKYTMQIVPTGTVSDIANVIDVYYAASDVTVADRDLSVLTKIGTLADIINGAAGTIVKDQMLASESDYATIVLKMQETAGNEYQGKSIGTTFDLNVVATQYTYESDSFNDQYDASAQYPVVTAASFADALTQLHTSKTAVINVTSDVDNITGIQTNADENLTVNLGGNTVKVSTLVGSAGTETQGMQLLKGSTVDLENGIYMPTNAGTQIIIQNYSNLTLNNMTIKDSASSAVNYGLSSNCGEVTIKGNTNITVAAGKTALDIMHWESVPSYNAAGTHVTIDSSMTGTITGKIDVYCYNNGAITKPVTDGGATLTIMGGTFVNSGLTLTEFSAFVPAGYGVTTNPNGSFTVHAN